MDNIDNEEFKEMDNKLEEVSTRTRSEAEEQTQDNKNGVFITSIKVVMEEKPAEDNSFVERIKKR